MDGAAPATTLYRARRDSEAALSWDFPVGNHPLFCLITPHIAALTEKAYLQELRVHQAWTQLPLGARHHYTRSLLLDEVVSTNAIEGVFSTRRQIEEVLAEENKQSPTHRRFRELSHLYLSLGQGEGSLPTSVEEIRQIYDQIMDGELSSDDQLDGKLFRADLVDVQNQSGQAVHRGFQPEAKIIQGLEVALEAMSDTAAPPLLCAVMSHFMFECVHPFYDGNGRTGRYLLGLRLSQLLSPATALTLSKVLNEDRRKYYRTFTDVEDLRNMGDGTPFAIMMLEALTATQRRLEDDLKARKYLLDQLQDVTVRKEKSGSTPYSPRDFKILFLLGQIDLFGLGGGTTIREIAAYLELSPQQTRRDLKKLEEFELIEATTLKPLRFVLSPQGRDILELPDPDTLHPAT